MKRRALWLVPALILLLGLGGFVWLRSNVDVLTGAIGRAVEASTGRPLILAEPPSLSVFPHIGLDVRGASWGTAADSLSVSAERAVIRMALLPLLSRSIEVHEIILESPKIVIREVERAEPPEVPDSPRGLDAAEADAGTDTSQKRIATLRLDLVRISDGEVLLESGQLEARLSGLDAELRDLAPDTTASLTLRARIDARQEARTLLADSAVSTRFILRPGAVSIREAQVRLTPVDALTGPTPDRAVAIVGHADLNIAQTALDNLDLRLTLAGMTARVLGEATSESGRLQISLDGSPRNALQALGVAYAPVGSAAMQALSLQGNLAFTPDAATLSDLQGSLDNSTLRGAAAYARSGALDLSLQVDALDLDAYLPAPGSAGPAAATGSQAEPAAAAAEAGQPAPLLPFPFKAELSVESLRTQGLRLDGVRAALSGSGDRFTLESCRFRVYKAQVTARGEADAASGEVRVQANADKLDAGNLLKDVADVNGVSGQVNLAADLTARTTDTAALRRSLSGTAAMTGALTLESSRLPEDWKRLASAGPALSLTAVDVKARADKGLISLNPISAKGPVVSLNGQGRINLPSDSLDIRVNATAAGLSLPLVAQGSLASPSYGVDPSGLIQNFLTTPDGVKAVEKGAKRVEKEVKNLFKGLR